MGSRIERLQDLVYDQQQRIYDLENLLKEKQEAYDRLLVKYKDGVYKEDVKRVWQQREQFEGGSDNED